MEGFYPKVQLAIPRFASNSVIVACAFPASRMDLISGFAHCPEPLTKNSR
jgi:hypothetical protein